ncbi:MAG: hypothetical protein QXI32_00845 [Candidatus Bathyarchaeia archaeon]
MVGDGGSEKDRGEAGERPKLGPFLAAVYSWGVRSGEAAERIMAREGNRLTPEQKAYLQHVIEEGRRARRFLEEHGIHLKPSSNE